MEAGDRHGRGLGIFPETKGGLRWRSWSRNLKNERNNPMKAKYSHPWLALATVALGLTFPAVGQAQDQPGTPKVELKINGRQVEMKDLRELAERAMTDLRLPEETKLLLRHRLADAAARAENADQAAPDPQAPANPRRRHEGAAAEGSGAWKLGIRCEPLDDLLHSHLSIPKDVGLVVREVMNDSPAAKAGLRTNDVLLAIGDKPLTQFPQLVEAVQRTARAGEPLVLKVLHEGKERTVTVKPEGSPPAANEGRGKPVTPDAAGPLADPGRVVGELRGMIERQQRQLDELRKRLAIQQQEIRKLRQSLSKEEIN